MNVRLASVGGCGSGTEGSMGMVSPVGIDRRTIAAGIGIDVVTGLLLLPEQASRLPARLWPRHQCRGLPSRAPVYPAKHPTGSASGRGSRGDARSGHEIESPAPDLHEVSGPAQQDLASGAHPGGSRGNHGVDGSRRRTAALGRRARVPVDTDGPVRAVRSRQGLSGSASQGNAVDPSRGRGPKALTRPASFPAERRGRRRHSPAQAGSAYRRGESGTTIVARLFITLNRFSAHPEAPSSHAAHGRSAHRRGLDAFNPKRHCGPHATGIDADPHDYLPHLAPECRQRPLDKVLK